MQIKRKIDFIMKKDKKKKQTNIHYDFVKLTGFIPAMLWFRPKVYHVGDKKKHDVKGAVMIVSNHVSFIDILLLLCIFWKRRLHSLATKDLFSNKLKKKFFTAVHCIVVDQDNFSMRSFHEIADRLKEGKAILAFPEGHINFESTNLQAFKSGIVLMAHMGKAPILPIYITKRDKWYKRTVAVIGDPIDLREICPERPSLDDLDKASQYVHNKELELEKYCHSQILKDTPCEENN